MKAWDISKLNDRQTGLLVKTGMKGIKDGTARTKIIANNSTLPDANMEQGIGDAPLATGKNAYFSTQVSIHIHSVRTRLADSDGVCYKYAIDELVNRGVLVDDSPKYVKQVTFSQSKGDKEETIITITEVDK